MALKFIHLTDPHLLAPGRALHGTDPTWRLRRAVASINAEHADAAFVVITGDLADRGEPAAYAALADCLAPLRMPVHLRRASSYLSRHQAARGRLSARVTAAVTTSVRSGFRVTVAMCDQLRVAPDHRRGLFWRAWA
jgi:3',5'-cyclic AMP phosphodiesterase CpdA